MKKNSLFLLVFFACLLIVGASQAASPDFMLKKMGAVNGQVYIDGHPAPYALISFFNKKRGLPPLEKGLRRVPEFLSRTDVDGKFTIKVPAGEYYTGVLLRDPGAVAGPPRQGEQYYFVKGEDGELGLLTIKEQEETDIGKLNAEYYKSFVSTEDSFVVEGVVRDKNGNPVPDVVVLGKSQLNIPRPEFISERTDENGFYRLQLPPGTPFYLVARETIAGTRPRPGNLIGTYGIESKTGLATPSIFGAGSPPPGAVNEGDNSKALTISGGVGELVGNADIYMYVVPDPEGIRTSIQGTVNSPKYEKGVELENINFGYDSSKLEQSSYEELNRWAAFLKGRVDINIEVRGHTDNVGQSAYNKILSKSRAQAVADYLIGHGIDSGRLIVMGLGSDEPIATNDTIEGRKLNRRVEIKFVN